MQPAESAGQIDPGLLNSNAMGLVAQAAPTQGRRRATDYVRHGGGRQNIGPKATFTFSIKKRKRNKKRGGKKTKKIKNKVKR